MDSNDEFVDSATAGIVTSYRWLLGFAGCFIAIVGVTVQVLNLNEPWHHGPWRLTFFVWLLIYYAWASYAAKIRELQAAAAEAKGACDEGESEAKLARWWQRIQPPSSQQLAWYWAPLIWIALCLIGPYLIALAIAWNLVVYVRNRWRVPANWVEPSLLIAAFSAVLLGPLYGPWPLMVTTLHIALVIIVRHYRFGSMMAPAKINRPKMLRE